MAGQPVSDGDYIVQIGNYSDVTTACEGKSPPLSFSHTTSEQRSSANVGSLNPPRRARGFRETGNGQDESSQMPSWNLLHALVRSTAVDQLCTEKTIRRLRNRPSRLVERSEFDRQSSSQVGHFGQVGVWISGCESRCRHRPGPSHGRIDQASGGGHPS